MGDVDRQQGPARAPRQVMGVVCQDVRWEMAGGFLHKGCADEQRDLALLRWRSWFVV